MSLTQIFNQKSHAHVIYDDQDTIWVDMQYASVPAFSLDLLRSLCQMQRDVESDIEKGVIKPSYLVVKSSTYSDAFGVGGDLAHFLACIEKNDRQGLKDYAEACVDALIGNQSPHYTSIALVDGECLGGGFETALSCNLIIAEKGVKFGFPEIMFGMFPGMGSVSFLSRRVNPGLAKRLVSEPRLYTAEEMYEMGVVDVLAEPGKAHDALQRFMQQNAQRSTGIRGIQNIMGNLYPISRDELQMSTDIWVDVAFQLSEHNLKLMKRLVRSQKMRWTFEESATGALPREAMYASNA